MSPRPILLVPLIALGAGCITAPDVVLLDRRTALEQQAAGRERALENELMQAGLSAKGEDYTKGQLVAAGVDSSRGALDTLTRIYGSVLSDSERVDDLLVRRCVGEATSALLQETPETCGGEVAGAEVGDLVRRANRDRRQVWAYIAGKSAGAAEADIAAAWRRNHLEAAVCGASVQQPDGSFAPKEC
jgi:hypothetical protein